MSEPEHPRPWWRKVRKSLSLRMLMVLVLVIGGGLGWIAHRARVQRRAVEAITKAGGTVSYDWQLPRRQAGTEGASVPLAEECSWTTPPGRITSTASSGSMIQARPTCESLAKVRADDALMAQIGQLERTVDLLIIADVPRGASVTDAGLAHLRRPDRGSRLLSIRGLRG